METSAILSTPRRRSGLMTERQELLTSEYISHPIQTKSQSVTTSTTESEQSIQYSRNSADKTEDDELISLSSERPLPPPPTQFRSGSELSSQLRANLALANLLPSAGTLSIQSETTLLPNQKCSGYFVEPMKWMNPFIDSGQSSGKIICPNERCNAKLGNYDWAGLCCGCKSEGEWVTPGFCISRSKVDEVTY